MRNQRKGSRATLKRKADLEAVVAYYIMRRDKTDRLSDPEEYFFWQAMANEARRKIEKA